MKCNSCEEDVPSKFAYAIATNVCPFCGDQIMEKELQEVLNGLREVMTSASAQNFEPQAFDWLKSNFDLISMEGEDYQALIGEIALLKEEVSTLKSKPAPKNIKAVDPIMKVDDEGHEYQENGEQMQDEDTTSIFMKRAFNVKKTSDLKKIVNKLKGGGSSGGGNITPEMMNMPLDKIEQWEMESGGIQGPYSAIDSGFDDGIDPVMEQFINQSVSLPGSNGRAADWNQKDAQILAKMHDRVQQNAEGRPEFKFRSGS